MARGNRRKCKCCLKFFRPDPRNRRHQRYCSAPRLQKQPARRRAKHAGSPNPRTRTTSGARPPRPRPGLAGAPSRLLAQVLARPCLRLKMSQWRNLLVPLPKRAIFVRSPLQDLLAAQPAVLIGLIAHLVGTPQQEDIVRTTDRLLRLGRDILALSQEPAVVIDYETFCQNPRLP